LSKKYIGVESSMAGTVSIMAATSSTPNIADDLGVVSRQNIKLPKTAVSDRCLVVKAQESS
jgi:hypothetical protein